MKKSILLLAGALLLSPMAYAKEPTAVVFNTSVDQGESTVGVRGALPLDKTTKTMQVMEQRWGKTAQSNVEFYGVIDIGYHGTITK